MQIVSDPFLEECGCRGVLSPDGSCMEIEIVRDVGTPEINLEECFDDNLPWNVGS